MFEFEKNNFIDIFSKIYVPSLINLLGKDILENLYEWDVTFKKSLNDPRTLSELIFNIHGSDIFNEKKTIGGLLKCLPSESKLKQLSLELGYNKRVSTQDLLKKISAKKIKNNSNSIKLLQLLGFKFKIRDDIDEDYYAEDVPEFCENATDFYELYDYQFVIQKRLLNYLESGQQKKCLIYMPTGAGKTKTCMHSIIKHYWMRLKNRGIILWVAHTQELLDQAMSSFYNTWEHLGNQKIKVSRFWGEYKLPSDLPENNHIIFAGLSKLVHAFKKKTTLISKLQKNFGIIVFDEAHKAPARETKKLIERELVPIREGFNDRCLVGLTATPGRSDYEGTEDLVAMFGNVQFSVEPELLDRLNQTQKKIVFKRKNKISALEYLQEKSYLSKVKREVIKSEENFDLSGDEIRKLKNAINSFGAKDFSADLLLEMGRRKKRNIKIINRLMELHKGGIPTIVFACSVEHAKLLHFILKINRISSGVVLGETNPLHRNKLITKFKNNTSELYILINFGVLTTGFDARNIGCVFITRPTASIVLYSQMLGRGLRGPRMGGKETCRLVDISDNIANFKDENFAYTYFKKYWS